MLLTTFVLNDARRGAQRLLRSPQRVKAAVLAGFRNDPGRVLWRLDDGPRPQQHTLTIQSQDAPSLRHLAEQAGWSDDDSWRTEQAARHSVGDILAFTARVQLMRASSAHAGKRQPLACDLDDIQCWFDDRSQQFGFTIDVASASQRSARFQHGADRITLNPLDLTGTLTVTDANAAAHTLTSGVGRARAYGCGLVLV